MPEVGGEVLLSIAIFSKTSNFVSFQGMLNTEISVVDYYSNF